MAGDMAGAKVAAAQVVRLDPNWSVEKYLSDAAAIQTMPPRCSSMPPESWSHCVCASGQALVNAKPYSYQGVR
jgi:hypothetical protein